MPPGIGYGKIAMGALGHLGRAATGRYGGTAMGMTLGAGYGTFQGVTRSDTSVIGGTIGGAVRGGMLGGALGMGRRFALGMRGNAAAASRGLDATGYAMFRQANRGMPRMRGPRSAAMSALRREMGSLRKFYRGFGRAVMSSNKPVNGIKGIAPGQMSFKF